MFLARTSNYVTRAKLPKVKAFAEGSTVLRAHRENQTLEGKYQFEGSQLPVPWEVTNLTAVAGLTHQFHLGTRLELQDNLK